MPCNFSLSLLAFNIMLGVLIMSIVAEDGGRQIYDNVDYNCNSSVDDTAFRFLFYTVNGAFFIILICNKLVSLPFNTATAWCLCVVKIVYNTWKATRRCCCCHVHKPWSLCCRSRGQAGLEESEGSLSRMEFAEND